MSNWNIKPIPSDVLLKKISALAVSSANSSIILPAKAIIKDIIVLNNTANAVTGGIKFGTSAGATDIASGLAIAGSALVSITDAALLKKIFSFSATQTIYFDAVVSWNSTNVDVIIVYSTLG